MLYLYDEPLFLTAARPDLTIDTGGGGAAAPAAPAETAAVGTAAAAEPDAPPAGFLDNWGTILVMYAVVFGAMYFLWMRPQNKKRKAAMEMQAAIKVGDNVMTSSGMYGTITMLGEQDCIVEFGTNKGIKIPIRRVDIVGVREPVLTAAAPTE